MIAKTLVWMSLGGAALGIATFVPACSPTPPPNNGPDTSTTSEPDRPRVGPTVESEIGALDEGKVRAAFNASAPALSDCFRSGTERIAFLAGEIKFGVRVGEDGATLRVFAKESTIGDRQTEQCMLNVVRKIRWPKPEGGREGIAESSFSFEASDEERPPIEWSEARMGDGYKRAKPALSKCKADASAGTMRATLYVETDGKAMGVGISGADAKSEDAASCVVEVLRGTTFASPGSYAAKVTITIE